MTNYNITTYLLSQVTNILFNAICSSHIYCFFRISKKKKNNNLTITNQTNNLSNRLFYSKKLNYLIIICFKISTKLYQLTKL